MTKKVTDKNTKTEILAAYNEALKMAEEAKKNGKVVEKVVEKKIVEKVQGITMDKLIEQTAKSKSGLLMAMEALMEQMSSEVTKLEDIKLAIVAKQEELHHIYGLKEILDDMQSIIDLRDAKKASAEEDSKLLMEEYNSLEQQLEVKLLESKGRYERDLEKLNYENSIKVRDSKDNLARTINEHNEKIAAVKKELGDLKALQDKLSSFDSEVAKAVEVSKREVEAKVKSSNDISLAMVKKDNANAIALKDQEILNLKEKNEELAKQVTELKESNSKLNDKVIEVTTKAIDGASKSSQNITVSAPEQFGKSR